MKQPLYAILIAPIEEMRARVLDGRKKITIREGHRDYKPGKVILCCHLEPWAVSADIVSVRHTTLGEVTDEEYESDGFADRENMLAVMRRFYPNITSDSPVTVIRWENVEGKLVPK